MTGAKLLGVNWLATTWYRSVLSFNYVQLLNKCWKTVSWLCSFSHSELQPNRECELPNSDKLLSSRAHPVISHCSHLLLNMQSGYKYKSLAKSTVYVVQNYIFAIKKVYFDQLLDFQILLLVFLHTLLFCHTLLFGCWIFSITSGCQTVWIQIRPELCRAWSGSKLFAKVNSK